MQISLKQQEVTAAVRAYIAAQGISLEGKEFSVKYTAGRGDTGLSAEVEILNRDMPDLVDDEASAAVASRAIAAAASGKANPLKAVKTDKATVEVKAPEQKPADTGVPVDPETGGEAEDLVAAVKPATPSLFS